MTRIRSAHGLSLLEADPIPIADTHRIVGQFFDGKILTELSMDEVGPLQLLLPIAVGFDLVDEDGALLTPVTGQVALAVPVEIQAADSTATGDRMLPDSGVHGATLPLDIAWKSDVHR
jgi:hypothetical protein